MPVYEYKCTACGHRFSLLESLSDGRTGKECPKCGSRDTNRVLSIFSSLRDMMEGADGCKPGG
jgi:putative FmdB family regulatory protein